jgi:superfamily II DNA or RNA helicase
MAGNLENQLRYLFSGPAVTRGRTYYVRGAVRIVSHDNNVIQAVVVGSSRYKVSLRLVESSVVLDCNCPFKVQYQKPCKHLWAAILACDDDGLWKTVHNLGGPADEIPVASASGAPGVVSDDAMDPLEVRRSAMRLKQNSPHWKNRLLKAQDPLHHLPIVKDHDASLYYCVHLPRTPKDPEGFALELFQVKHLKNGTQGAFYSVRFETAQSAFKDSPEDEQVLALLMGFKPEIAQNNNLGISSHASRFLLTPAAATIILPRACATGRCILESASAIPLDPTVLSWDNGQPWALRLTLEPTENPENLRLVGLLHRESETLDSSKITPLPGVGLFVSENTFHTLSDDGDGKWISMLGNLPPVIPRKEMADFLTAFFQSTHVPELVLPDEWALQRQTVEPKPRLIFRYKVPPSAGRLTAELSFDYGGTRVSERQAGAFLYRPSEQTLINRNLPFEADCAAKLGPLGFPWVTTWGTSTREGAASLLPDAVAALLPFGWQIEATGTLYRSGGTLKGGIKSSKDWFDLELDVTFDGVPAPITALLAALQKGERFVKLDDGSTGLLPEAWLKRYGLAVRLGDVNEDTIRFTPGQIGLLDALLAEQPEVSLDKLFSKVRKKLTSFDQLDLVEPPKSFKGTLRAYQKTGLGWLLFLQDFGFGGCLADDMGLGKTVQVLALLETRRLLREKIKGKQHGLPSLAVVPKSLVFNWREEALRFTPKLKLLEHAGIQRLPPDEHFNQYDLILTTYGTLRRDAAQFSSQHFDYVILDEAHAVKNPKSESAKAVRLLNGDHRLALTGTPVQNHLGELWSLFDFLNPGMLGVSTAISASLGQNDAEGSNQALLTKALKPFLLRRTKEKVATDLPAKTEQVLYCQMGQAQKAIYDGLRAHYRENLLKRVDQEGLGRSKMHVLEALLRLRQAACHPGLLDPSQKMERGSKLDALIPSLEEVLEEGHKAIVFSQFTSFLSIVQDHLAPLKMPYAYLDGATRDREEQVRRFQNDKDCSLFLISLKAGGLGLNLTEAEYVYLLDPWWNPAVEAQAIDRAHRIGQTKRVSAYRLISQGTVEEKIVAMQKEKKKMAEAVLNPEGGLLGNLTREDLEMLLS